MPTISDLPSGTPSTSDILPFVQSVSTKKATFGSLPISTPVQEALDEKQDTLVSNSNIKTINGASLLGTGNIIVGDGGLDETSASTNALKSATTTINVSSATAPTEGQVLTATSDSAATWQTFNIPTNFQYPHSKIGLVPFAKIVTNATYYTPTSGKVGYVTWARMDASTEPYLQLNGITILFPGYNASNGVTILNNPLILDDSDYLSSTLATGISCMGFEVPASASITPIMTSGSYTVPANKVYVLTNWYTTSTTLISSAFTVGGVSVNAYGISNWATTDIDSITLAPIILGAGDSVNSANINHHGYLVSDTFIK